MRTRDIFVFSLFYLGLPKATADPHYERLVVLVNSFQKGRLSTVDLLVLTRLGQLLLILQTLFIYYKTRYPDVEVY